MARATVELTPDSELELELYEHSPHGFERIAITTGGLARLLEAVFHTCAAVTAGEVLGRVSELSELVQELGLGEVVDRQEAPAEEASCVENR